MRNLIIVCTTERPHGADYLPETLAHLDRGGAPAEGKLVLSDGPRTGPCAWPLRIIGPGRAGNVGALWAAFDVAREMDADKLLFFEDDINVCADSVPRMLDHIVPLDSAFITFFDARRVASWASPGIYKLMHETFGCCQAMLFPRASLDWLCTRGRELLPTTGEIYSDGALAGSLKSSPWPFYSIHHPSLVQHRGAISNLFEGAPLSRQRTSRSYLGDDFDAKTLARWSDVRPDELSNPTRIRPILDAIEEIWRKLPDHTLGQILSVVVASKDHLAQLEDAQLVEKLRERYGIVRA